MAPAIAPLATPTARGLAPARPATHPIGAAIAPLAAMRAHTAGISSGFCRARAAPSTAASAAPPSTAPVIAARGPRCAVSAAPARAPMAAENPIDCARLESTGPVSHGCAVARGPPRTSHANRTLVDQTEPWST
ncbi:hypothetical protein [Dactylosporangium darangshiense]|uniref:hypothetical protein n=1 Tax=Dactylosporangium darangshiense TaxID=579108 RepID=UPI0036339307